MKSLIKVNSENEVFVVFMPIAEQTGSITKMADWAIRRACVDAVSSPESVDVAANVLPVQFRDPSRLAIRSRTPC